MDDFITSQKEGYLRLEALEKALKFHAFSDGIDEVLKSAEKIKNYLINGQTNITNETTTN